MQPLRACANPARGGQLPPMSALRSFLLTALPKVALSRACGLLCSLPLPTGLREPLFRWFARRYGASLDDIAAPLQGFRSMQEFFRRALRPTARPIAKAALVWPCDGRIVTIGPIDGDRIEQVKGRRYALADLLGDATYAAQFAGGQQVTIYLAPGDYHRVHAPFAATVERVDALPGTLFPVNPPAVRSIRDLFARNSRHVFRCRLTNGQPAAVVMVGAYNVGGTKVTCSHGKVAAGGELGQFGFGSTTIVVLPAAATEPPLPRFQALAPEQRVVMGGAAAAD